MTMSVQLRWSVAWLAARQQRRWLRNLGDAVVQSMRSGVHAPRDA
jgi:hypothetical protein